MVNINLGSLNTNELLTIAETVANGYEEKKKNGDEYGDYDIKDIFELEKHLQRAVFYSEKGRELYQKLKQILADDAGIKELWQL